MNPRTLALLATLSASSVSAQSYATTTVPVSDFETRTPTVRLDVVPYSRSALPESRAVPDSTVRSHGGPRVLHLPHMPHQRHFPVSYHEVSLTKNSPTHEYIAAVHLPALSSMGFRHHVSLDLGLLVATEPHVHHREAHTGYSIRRTPGVVVGFAIR